MTEDDINKAGERGYALFKERYPDMPEFGALHNNWQWRDLARTWFNHPDAAPAHFTEECIAQAVKEALHPVPDTAKLPEIKKTKTSKK